MISRLLQAPLASKGRVGNNSGDNMRGGGRGRGAGSGQSSAEQGQRGGPSSRGGGRGGIGGSGIGPLSLLQGTRKMLQDVSGVVFRAR
jgi:hypothetical protein